MSSRISKTKSPLKFAILGPTGLGGSAISVELIHRGHHVTGMSRNPEKLGKHELYQTTKVDLTKVSMDDLTAMLKGFDVVIEYWSSIL